MMDTAKINRLERHKSALLVIDTQERLMPVIAGREEVVKNSVLLIQTAKVLQIPILATTQYAAKIGNLVPEVRTNLEEVQTLDKVEFDCFANSDIAAATKKLGRDINTIIACGVETHICVYQSVAGGLAAGYNMWVAADAVSSRRPENHAIGLQRISENGGVVGCTELIVYELLHKAGTAEFKAILPYIK